jgi:hypothetical protein
MSHINDRTLEKLIDGSATAIEVLRIRRHTEDCRACARRLEEWRDNFSEVAEHFPELAIDPEANSMVTTGGMVLLPSSAPRRRFELDLTSALWIGVGVMTVLAGLGALRLREARSRTEVAVYDLPQPLDPDSGSRQGATPTPPVTPSRDSSPRPEPSGPPAPKPPATPPPTGPIAVSPQFKSVSLADAAERLGGPVRLLGGMQPDHVEIGPPSAVHGAQSGLSVIRVVYRAPDGGRILLDQQLIPEDSSGFRPIEDPALESGGTAYRKLARGVNVATWLDDDGYRISLAMRTSVDSLKRLVPLVH